MKRFVSIIALALVIGLVAGNAEAKGAKGAKGDKAGKKAAVHGTVTKVDGLSIVVQTKGKKGAEVTIVTDTSTDIKVNGAKGALTDIKPGMKITATPNTGTATKVIVGEGKGKGEKKPKKPK